MFKTLLSLSLYASFFILSGCEEIRSEAWYKQHPDETYEVYMQCLKDGEASDNCEFAQRAAIMYAQIGKPEIKEKFEALFQLEAEKRKNVTQ
ncbi:EexN family lipoprotein [Citrobacter telavivensis]